MYYLSIPLTTLDFWPIIDSYTSQGRAGGALVTITGYF